LHIETILFQIETILFCVLQLVAVKVLAKAHRHVLIMKPTIPKGGKQYYHRRGERTITWHMQSITAICTSDTKRPRKVRHNNNHKYTTTNHNNTTTTNEMR